MSQLSKVDSSGFGRKIRDFEAYSAAHISAQSVLGTLRTSVPTVSDLIQSTAEVLLDLKKTTLAAHGLRLDNVLVTMLPLEDRRLSYKIYKRQRGRLISVFCFMVP